MKAKFEKILGNAPEGRSFYTNFGEIKNLKELRTQMFSYGKKFYNEYVTENENHFANWVENVFEDHTLARKMRCSNSFGTTLKVLDNRIKYLELWILHNKEADKLDEFLVNMNKNNLNYEPGFHKFETLTNHSLDVYAYKEDSEKMLNTLREKKKLDVPLNKPLNNEAEDDESFEQKHSRDIEMLKKLQEDFNSKNKINKPSMNFFTRFSLFKRK